MSPEEGNLHRPPKQKQNENKNENNIFERGEHLGGYPPGQFEHIAVRRPVCLIYSEGKWKDMRAKWKQN